ncbi:hypothetical protein C8R45DRAFT_1103649 [Mycena sanguinolenta]|nr:hypothetical protein C8R45DRAFT_1103649 [Mycena sanguinolenta]
MLHNVFALAVGHRRRFRLLRRGPGLRGVEQRVLLLPYRSPGVSSRSSRSGSRTWTSSMLGWWDGYDSMAREGGSRGIQRSSRAAGASTDSLTPPALFVDKRRRIARTRRLPSSACVIHDSFTQPSLRPLSSSSASPPTSYSASCCISVCTKTLRRSSAPRRSHAPCFGVGEGTRTRRRVNALKDRWSGMEGKQARGRRLLQRTWTSANTCWMDLPTSSSRYTTARPVFTIPSAQTHAFANQVRSRIKVTPDVYADTSGPQQTKHQAHFHRQQGSPAHTMKPLSQAPEQSLHEAFLRGYAPRAVDGQARTQLVDARGAARIDNSRGTARWGPDWEDGMGRAKPQILYRPAYRPPLCLRSMHCRVVRCGR